MVNLHSRVETSAWAIYIIYINERIFESNGDAH